MLSTDILSSFPQQCVCVCVCVCTAVLKFTFLCTNCRDSQYTCKRDSGWYT